MMMRQPFSRRALLAGVGATAVAARSTTLHAADADWQAGASEEWRRVLAAARTEGSITVAGFPQLEEKMSAAFKRDTGITMNFLSSNTAEQSARLEAEARAKNLTIHILLGGRREP